MGRCCLGNLCQHPTLQLISEFICLKCKGLVHVPCAIWDDKAEKYICQQCVTSSNNVDVVTDSTQISDTDTSITTPTTEAELNQLTIENQPIALTPATVQAEPIPPTQNAVDLARKVGQCCIGNMCQHPALQLISEFRCEKCKGHIHIPCAVWDNNAEKYICQQCVTASNTIDITDLSQLSDEDEHNSVLL